MNYFQIELFNSSGEKFLYFFHITIYIKDISVFATLLCFYQPLEVWTCSKVAIFWGAL